MMNNSTQDNSYNTYVKYQIMHGERKVASIDTQGRCTVFDQDFICLKIIYLMLSWMWHCAADR